MLTLMWITSLALLLLLSLLLGVWDQTKMTCKSHDFVEFIVTMPYFVDFAISSKQLGTAHFMIATF